MFNYLLFTIIIVISIYQIIKIRKNQEYTIFPFMIATCCMIIGKPLDTKLGCIISIVVSTIFLIYMIVLIIVEIRNNRGKNRDIDSF